MADTKISALPASTTPLAGTEVLPIVQGGATKQVSVADLTAGRQTSASGFEALGATGLTPAAPILYQIKNTTNGTGWSTTAPWGRYSFYSDDASGAGPKTHIALDAVMRASSGAYSKLSIKLDDSTGNLVERVLIDPVAGNTTISTGNLVIGTAGKGIDFSANGGDVLTQYDEGTWNCSLYDDGGLKDNQATSGQYVRIGNLVYISARIFNGSAFTASGNVYMNLPFAAGANTVNAACPVVYSVDAGSTLGVYIADGSDKAYLSTASSNMLGSTVTTGASFTASKRLYFSLVYSLV